MGLSCPLGIACFVPTKVTFFGVIFWPYDESFIDQASVNIGLVLFLRFNGAALRLEKCKKELGQYPAILTSCLVNNAYLLPLLILMTLKVPQSKIAVQLLVPL